MMRMTWMRWMGWCVPFAMVVCAVADLEAQRGGGGGLSRSGAASSGTFGGARSGGGNVSSSGVASSGTWQANRADMQASRQSQQASSQASRQQQQASRQQQQASSQASRQSQQQEMQSSRQSSAQELQSTRSQEKAASREDWQSHGTQRQEDRQSYGEDARRQRQDYADDYLDDYHRHSYGSYPVGAGLAVVGAVAVGTAITASAFQAMSCPMAPVVVNGYTYYQCGSAWYQPTYQGSSVTYVVVNPPK
jgi:hypothetical protein